LRYLYALMGIFLLLAASAAGGRFLPVMDVDTYADANKANQSYTDSDILLVSSQDGKSTTEVYLSFNNSFGSQSIFSPEQIKSATLTLNAANVEKAGKIRAYFLEGAVLDTVTWYDKTDYDREVSSSPLEVDDVGSYALDVTDIIKKAVETCTETCPYTIVLVAEDGAFVEFTSREASEEKKPVLEYRTEE